MVLGHRTVVLGAGAAGLTAAWELVKGGRRVSVVELERTPGGLCRTFEREGYRFDLGGHRFISQDQELTQEISTLMGDALLEPTRQSLILLRGKRYRYPLEPLDVLRNLEPILGAKGFWDYLRERLKRQLPGREESFRTWTVARYGQTFYDIFFGPYTEKLWGIPAHTLSADWAAQRISLLNLGDVLLRLLRLRRSHTRTYARRYMYPREGIGQIFHVLAKEVAGRGGEILYQTRVVGFERRRDRVVAVVIESGGERRSLPCDQVISTLPLPDVARMLYPRNAHVQRQAERLNYRGVRFLNIMLDREDISENTWIYVPDPRCIFTRIQEPKRRSPQSAPEGKTSLMLEIPCEVGGELWNQPEADLLSRCLDELKILGFELHASVEDSFTTRITHGYPVFELGYREPRDRLLAALGEFNNVTTCGRQGTFRYIFMDTAMQMGQLAARALVEGRKRTDEIVGMHSTEALLETKAVTA
jgi:protoporphyrinogen oxidase